MATTLYVTFDGDVFKPEGPVPLAPNTRLRVTIEEEEQAEPRRAASFLETAMSIDLDGAPDWSSRMHDYLYGEGGERAE